MSARPIDLPFAPPPAVARPARWPLAVAVAAALALTATRRFGSVGWCGGSAVVAAFFFGRRVGGRWTGVVGSLTAAAGWLIWPVSPAVAAALALALVGAWWVTRFVDDPAPFNGLVAGTALGTLVLVHRFGVVGTLAAVLFLSSRLRPLWMGWPWVTGALVGWLVARAQPWF
jgi:hypothetical protein